MSLAEIEPRNLSRHYRDVRLRLVFPPNAREDLGIDLKRREPQAIAPIEPPRYQNLPHYRGFAIILGYAPLPENALYQIQRATCTYFGVSLRELIGAGKTNTIVWPRHVAMYLVNRLTGKSFPDIGQRFGDRDHTTVMHAVRKIAGLCLTNSACAFDVATIEAALNFPPRPDAKVEVNPPVRLGEADCRRVVERVEAGESRKRIAHDFQIQVGTVGKILRRKGGTV